MFDEKRLDELLSQPSEGLIDDFRRLDGDVMILGAGGKVGPTLSLMAARALKAAGRGARAIAVSRFSDPAVKSLLNDGGVETLSAELTDPASVAKLPRVKNIIYMAGRKFGTGADACQTWAMNVSAPTIAAEHFGDANYVVFSTGNVYPLSPLSGGGCRESDPVGPVGEYAMSSLGRERVFEYAAKKHGARVLMFRLNYAIDLRYGVLYDIAKRIIDGEPVSLTSPCFNCAWQGYVNEIALRSLLIADNPPKALNVTGPETVSVRAAATLLGEYLGKTPVFEGRESDVSLLSNAEECVRLFGYPAVGVGQLIKWQAEWLLAGGRTLNKPTHFEERAGKF